MKKLNFFGAGPKIGRIIFPWLAITIVLTLTVKESFIFTSNRIATLRLAGYIISGIGIILYLTTVRSLLKGLRETKLVTTGGYYLCQNPPLRIVPTVSDSGYCVNNELMVDSYNDNNRLYNV
jgi:hypothetical protein